MCNESFIQACSLIVCKKIIRHDKSTFLYYTRAFFKHVLLMIIDKQSLFCSNMFFRL